MVRRVGQDIFRQPDGQVTAEEPIADAARGVDSGPRCGVMGAYGGWNVGSWCDDVRDR